MARYKNTLTPTGDVNDVHARIEKYLTTEGFKQMDYKGEQIWKKGIGLMLGPQFIKLTLQGNSIEFEAWIRFALLPGVYVGEMGIDGLFGLIPKRLLKKRVQQIENLLQT